MWRYLLAIIIFAAVLIRWHPTTDNAGRVNNLGYESLQTAYSLAHGYGFANPFYGALSGPTAHLAPVFPFFVSGVIRVLGDGRSALYVIGWMGTLAAAFQFSLWPFAARRLGMGFASGVLAAGVWLLIGLPPRTVWEADYVAALVIVLSMLMYKVLTERCSQRYMLIVAAMWGLTILASPVVLLPFGVFVLWTWFRSAATLEQKLALVAIPILVLVPWTVRNYRTFHHLFFIRDNLGLELGVSNNPCARYSLMATEVAQCYIHPNQDPHERQRLVALGEYNYNQQRLREARQWISDNPAKFAELTRRRVRAFWFPEDNENPLTARVTVDAVIFWLMTVLSIPGLVSLWRKDWVGAGICLVWLVAFPPIYYLHMFNARYRVPILWATFIPASYAITVVVARFWPGPRVKSLRARAGSSQSSAT